MALALALALYLELNYSKWQQTALFIGGRQPC